MKTRNVVSVSMLALTFAGGCGGQSSFAQQIVTSTDAGSTNPIVPCLGEAKDAGIIGVNIAIGSETVFPTIYAVLRPNPSFTPSIRSGCIQAGSEYWQPYCTDASCSAYTTSLVLSSTDVLLKTPVPVGSYVSACGNFGNDNVPVVECEQIDFTGQH